jgi:predicted acetyltransferase
LMSASLASLRRRSEPGLAIEWDVLELALPTTRLHDAFLDCRREWGPGIHEDGFSLTDEDQIESAAGFAEWVEFWLNRTHPAGEPCPPGPHCSPRWIVENGRVLGGIVLRHVYDDQVGQIGYGVRPSARRRGVAGWALGQMLLETRAALDIDQVLVPCLDENVASARTIESQGGILEGVRTLEDGVLLRRYWVPVPTST